jgi:hypothetical protein
VAKVLVNGELAGYIAYQPWELDVSRSIHEGANTIKVVVIGTLKNPLGPHHNGPQLGSAAPWLFRQAPNPGPPPAEKYHTVGYGLFRPFQLIERSPE